MPRTNTGTFMVFQDVRLPGMGTMSLPDAVAASLDDLQSGAPFVGSWLDEIASIINTTLTDLNYRPNGDHLAGRNVESELNAGREALLLVRDDVERDSGLRAAVIPEIAKVEQQIQRRDFMKPLRDPEWGGDILEFVTRMASHEIFVQDGATGLFVAQTVALKLETVEAEIDMNGEICCWMYEES